MGISIIMLLLCQTAATVLAYAMAPVVERAHVTADNTSTPCQQSTLDTDGSTPVHGCQDRCASRYASLETAKVKIPAAISLAVPVFTVDLPSPRASLTPRSQRHERIVASAAPPPLILVFGRLLI
jgi:hypothetical protein